MTQKEVWDILEKRLTKITLGSYYDKILTFIFCEAKLLKFELIINRLPCWRRAWVARSLMDSSSSLKCDMSSSNVPNGCIQHVFILKSFLLANNSPVLLQSKHKQTPITSLSSFILLQSRCNVDWRLPQNLCIFYHQYKHYKTVYPTIVHVS